jgi:hypothetical protein
VQATKLRDHLLRQAIAEVLLVRIARQVLEGQHGQLDRFRNRWTSAEPLPHAADIPPHQ